MVVNNDINQFTITANQSKVKYQLYEKKSYDEE